MEETKLSYYRARYYDSSIGRFISEDPIGFNGGANFYVYVLNAPINFDDPFGRVAQTTVRFSPPEL
jgi:RHS repeat-associated protein